MGKSSKGKRASCSFAAIKRGILSQSASNVGALMAFIYAFLGSDYSLCYLKASQPSESYSLIIPPSVRLLYSGRPVNGSHGATTKCKIQSSTVEPVSNRSENGSLLRQSLSITHQMSPARG